MDPRSEGDASKQEAGRAGLTMSSITGKLVLALIRDSDYAHAGEAEAIDRVFEHLPKRGEQTVLDVGCGIGGTAGYVEAQGWGKVVGIDIDPDNIDAARDRHRGIDFHASDAARLDDVVSGPFDVLYSFNAFFLFDARPAALGAMRRVAKQGAKLAIFDYVDLGSDGTGGAGSTGMRKALRTEEMARMLPEHGWAVDEVVPMHAEYGRWYRDLVERIDAKHAAIVAQSSEAFFEFVRTRYRLTSEDIEAGRLGGATFYARAQ